MAEVAVEGMAGAGCRGVGPHQPGKVLAGCG